MAGLTWPAPRNFDRLIPATPASAKRRGSIALLVPAASLSASGFLALQPVLGATSTYAVASCSL